MTWSTPHGRIDERSVDDRAVAGNRIDERSVDDRAVAGNRIDERSVDDRAVAGNHVDDPQVDDGPVNDEHVDRAPTDNVGDPRVVAALERLDALADRPPPEHVEVYEDVHSTLQDVLAEATGRADERPA